jgi:hypothetical protein
MMVDFARRSITRLRRLAEAFRDNPRYVLMRGVARFVIVRRVATWWRRHVVRTGTDVGGASVSASGSQSMFPGVDPDRFVQELRQSGTALGLRLPEEITRQIHAFAMSTPCFADREPDKGFFLADYKRAEASIGKPILLAQYFNTEQGSEAIRRLCSDVTIQAIAAKYLDAAPLLVGVDLWWTFPVEATESDRSRHAHFFHRDVDDFKFLKFFFYLTDVGPADGPHVVVIGSHKRPIDNRWLGRLSLRRLTDAQVDNRFGPDSVRTILGEAGDGFAEDTFGVHKGMTPEGQQRLILQLQFALFDYGNTDDHRSSDRLRMLV